jgi:L-fuculose-phosphate aldolase
MKSHRRTEDDLRQEIARVCRLMYEKGFIWASDGNVSARLSPGRILITPSGLHKGFLQPDQILLVNEQGERLPASTPANRDLKPTSELPMHLEAYRRRPDIGAVVHAHPPITIALSIAGISMADCLLPETVVFLGAIPTTAYATPSSEENVHAIRDLIVNHDALVLQRHGSLTVGDDPMQGYMRLETMEQNARVAFMLAQLGVRNPLPPDETRKLLELRRQLGLSRPGEAAEFCELCGVCHEGDDHLPLKDTAVAHTIANPDSAVIRQIVSQVVQQTIWGKS